MLSWKAWTTLAAAHLAAACSTVAPARMTAPAVPAPVPTERPETLRPETKKPVADPIDVALAGFGRRPFSPPVPPLDMIDLSHPITSAESGIIATAYFDSVFGCGGIDRVEERPNGWRWTVEVGAAPQELPEHIVVNKRTGGVSGLGPSYRSLAELKQALAHRR